MAYSFNDDDKAATDFEERIPFGVSEVTLVGAVSGQTNDGKDFIELTVADKNGLEDNARFWFTGGASPYSFQGLRQIIVHTAKEADKEKARMAVESTADTDSLAELMMKQCVGKQLWFTKFYSPDRTYVNQNGDTKRSIDNRAYGYAPKDRPELMPTAADTNKTVSTPFGDATETTTADAAGAIPADGAWGDDAKAE